jgi:uncharacterized protein YgiM (DUF1202 family)
MISSTLLAQDVTNPAPIATPGPAALATNTVSAGTNKPAKPKKSAAKKTAPKTPPVELRTTPLVAGPAVVEANNVNVRGQAKLKSEVVTRLKKGDTVTVLEEITHNNSGADEPSAWARILLPTNAHVWVSTRYLGSTNKSVVPKKLNVRSGPGENFSVLGQLYQGDVVTELETKGEWTQIAPPTNAYAFVAAQFLKQEPATGAPPTVPVEPAPPPTAVAEPPTIAGAATEAPAMTNNPPEPEPPAIESSTNEPPPAVAEEPPPKRIVEREGRVRGTISIQAPTHFALVSPDNGKLIDYLYTTSPNLDLRRYKGLRIIVTGEEGLDNRWGNTPVITIQKIQVLEDYPPSGY